MSSPTPPSLPPQNRLVTLLVGAQNPWPTK